MNLAGVTSFEAIGGLATLAGAIFIICMFWIFAKGQIKEMIEFFYSLRGSLGGSKSKGKR